MLWSGRMSIIHSQRLYVQTHTVLWHGDKLCICLHAALYWENNFKQHPCFTLRGKKKSLMVCDWHCQIDFQMYLAVQCEGGDRGLKVWEVGRDNFQPPRFRKPLNSRLLNCSQCLADVCIIIKQDYFVLTAAAIKRHSCLFAWERTASLARSRYPVKRLRLRWTRILHSWARRPASSPRRSPFSIYTEHRLH